METPPYPWEKRFTSDDGKSHGACFIQSNLQGLFINSDDLFAHLCLFGAQLRQIKFFPMTY